VTRDEDSLDVVDAAARESLAAWPGVAQVHPGLFSLVVGGTERAELRRLDPAGRLLVVVSGYQEREVRPLLEIMTATRDTVVRRGNLPRN